MFLLLFFTVFFIGLVIAGFIVVNDVRGSKGQSYFKYEKFVSEDHEQILSFAFTGDIMLGSLYPDSSILPPCKAGQLFEHVLAFLQEADAAFGNLEGVIYEGEELPRKCRVPDSCYRFKMPPLYAPALSHAGFDFLSLANNHIYDFGHIGKNHTKKILDSLGILYAGLPEIPTVIKEVKGIKVGFIAFAPNAGTLQFRQIDKAVELVADLKEETDIVVVSFHGGGEGTDFRHINRENEFYMNENRGNPFLFARSVVDAGADIVFGHGPHVTRGLELYKGKIIMYSLGNFCTYGRFNLKSYSGIAPLMLINVNTNGDFVSGQIIPIVQKGRGKPEVDPAKKAVKEMQRLSLIDFPESPLFIDDDGQIFIDSIALRITLGLPL